MKRMLIISLIAIFVLPLLSACTVVKPGHAGVKVLFGNVRENTLDPGFHTTGFAGVQQISLQAQSLTDEVGEDSVNAAQVTFGDTLQSLGYTSDIQWRIANAEAARELYEQYDLRQGGEIAFAEERLRPLVREGVKQIFNNYTLRDLIEERDSAAILAEERIQELLNDRLTLPDNSVIIDDVALTNFDYDEALERSFRATIQARQDQELAQQNLERQRIEMQLQVAQAEAQRTAQVEAATGRAEAARIEADAARYQREQEAAANAAFYRSLSEAGVDINMYLYTQTWDGSVPRVNGGSSDGSLQMPVVLPLMPDSVQ
jgi:regulator of protease activity HflC (stomatin/prohibitin superfamily)